jgi:hypothetical protein
MKAETETWSFIWSSDKHWDVRRAMFDWFAGFGSLRGGPSGGAGDFYQSSAEFSSSSISHIKILSEK